MDLIRVGDRGEAVLDVQTKLVALGYSIPAEERTGAFGEGTRRAVRSFQQARGIAIDGVVGPDTWRELVEASWTLGDRTLYLRAPMMRGDDVRAVQDKLATFGFDCGRIDGIYGSDTERAVREFQHNYGLEPDGIVSTGTVRALSGLPAMAGDLPAASLREREQMRLRAGGLAELRIVLDPGRGGSDPAEPPDLVARAAALSHAICSRVEALLAASGAQVYLTRGEDEAPTESERAALANALDAHVFLGVSLCGGEDARGVATFYFGHSRYHSESGKRLAEALHDRVRALGFEDRGTHARTFSALRETRMTAVVLEPGCVANADEEALLADERFQARLAEAITAATRDYVGTPAG